MSRSIAHLDPFSGIAGDMFLGACLDAGAISAGWLTERFALLGLGSVRVSADRVKRGGLSGTSVGFQVDSGETPSRDWRDIRQLITGSGLNAPERDRALDIFQRLAEAEAKVHDVPMDDVHFHEVGALDSILDIVGAAVAIEAFGVERWSSAPINVGSGTVATQHGTLPVPAPATLELLMGLPTYADGPAVELTTPTGAAILRHLDPSFARPMARWSSIGYGAGRRDFAGQSNVLRFSVGESVEPTTSMGEMAVMIETDVDDMAPQWLPYVQERLVEQGAQDVTWHPIQMKKGRPGIRINVLSEPSSVDTLCEVLFAETTTIGVRTYELGKRRLDREIREVETAYGTIRVKVARLGDRAVNVQPEHDDCVAAARANNVPLKVVLDEAKRSAYDVGL